jgi:hypothetical protein
MSYRRFSLFCSVLVVELLCVTVYAQSLLHYSFKPGERLEYHYKISSTLESMGRRGGGESVTEFETDPEWDIEDVTTAGEAHAILTMRNRNETYVQGHRRLNFLHFTPRSEIAMDHNGALVFARIIADDTQRSLTKKYIGKIPGLSLASDFDVLLPYFDRVWYAMDSASVDTTGVLYTERYDSIAAQPYEHDTMVYGRLDTFRTAAIDSLRTDGTNKYTLHDTVINGVHFWTLHIDSDSQSAMTRYPSRSQQHSHKISDLLFRKQDGILQSWHYTLEVHANNAIASSEMWLTLTSLVGN